MKAVLHKISLSPFSLPVMPSAAACRRQLVTAQIKIPTISLCRAYISIISSTNNIMMTVLFRI